MRFGDECLDARRTAPPAHRSDDDDIAVGRDFQWGVGADPGLVEQRLVEDERETVARANQFLDHASLPYVQRSPYGQDGVNVSPFDVRRDRPPRGPCAAPPARWRPSTPA